MAQKPRQQPASRQPSHRAQHELAVHMPVHQHEAVEPMRTAMGYELVPDSNGCLDTVGKHGVKSYSVVGAPGRDGAPT